MKQENNDPIKHRILHTDEGYVVEGFFSEWRRCNWIEKNVFGKKDELIEYWHSLNKWGSYRKGADFDAYLGISWPAQSKARFKTIEKAERFVKRMHMKPEVVMESSIL